MPRLLLVLALLLTGLTLPAQAQDHPEETSRAKIAAFNVALTGTFALGRCWVEGELESWQEAVEIFLYGGAGGYGFYQAKQLVGRGKPVAGLGLAQLSSSVVENAVQNRHPLSHLRFGPGPVDLRVRTPLARTTDSPPVTLEINALTTVFDLIHLVRSGRQPLFAGGTIGFRNTAAADLSTAGSHRADGYAVGRSFVLSRDAEPLTTRHELIHVIQVLQAGATTPYYRLSALRPGLNRSLGSFLAWDVQLDWLYGVLAPASLIIDYDQRWTEIEAHTLDSPGTDEPPRSVTPY